ncbi:transposase [Sulfobacillus thermosulfidooxidans]|uniref:transposase n=1 Tax=Sulfobacillus thermosulfidooxidans TaxID=28034 RepID=UPI001FA89F80|nr:transposase [Sulfobacillus thermosulfidooxidans]
MYNVAAPSLSITLQGSTGQLTLLKPRKRTRIRQCSPHAQSFCRSLTKVLWETLLLARAYYVGSVGEASLETVKRYVEAQGTQEKLRKAA